MATKGKVAYQPRGSRRHQLYESRREREFYRYYEPIRDLTEGGPSLCDLHDEAAVRSHLPISSPDRALTAFCQLGALRLGTRRALLFFFDSNYAYVLAEATRTLSLVDDSVHEVEDKLWLGHTIIPRGFSICEETVCRLPDDDEPSNSQSDTALLHIINDIDKDTQFCDRPYVTDGPKAKFYAGVPITTPKGINIGAYCCLDDQKRDGLNDKEIAFMKDMAQTVMTHLDMVRAKAEHERGTQMVCGLNAFIEGASTIQHWEEETERRDRRLLGLPVSPQPRPTLDVLPTSIPPLTGHGHMDPEPSPNASSQNSAESVQTLSGATLSVEAAAAEPAAAVPSTPAKTSRVAEDLRDQLIASNVRAAFHRAAALVREAVDVDGAVFMDATPATYGGLLESGQDSSDQTSDAVVSATEAANAENEGRRRVKVLASAHSTIDRYDSEGQLQGDINGTHITEKFLRTLLRRHPHGKIWNFGEDGDASSDDESSEGCGHRRGCSCKPGPRSESSDADDSSAKWTSRRRRARVDDGREIQRLFPGVRSLALVGMWDQNRGRWFSACAVWTYSPFRLFSPELELNYMAAFNDVIMAELHRLEAQNSSKAQTDFISSISHELRSPLHGILGSVEVLQEQPSGDSYSQGLISQIDICGRTLLDIVDHLLDFSKINHHAKSKQTQSNGGNSRVRRRVSSSDSKGRKSQLETVMALDLDVPLDHMTEEVVEAAVYSFCCARDKDFILNRKVAVILDIDRSANINWRCKIPTGGWKRICINLVSNALKYTNEGFIKVTLKAEPIPGKKRKQSIIFTVSDSGCGMSKNFLENHLFKAFAQEDSLKEGTGLGMSLVAKIIRAMNGKVEVQSEKGKGTTMTVTLPVEIVGKPSKEAAMSSLSIIRKTTDRATVGIVGFEEVSSATPANTEQAVRKMILNSIERNSGSLGLRVRRSTESGYKDADVFLISEGDLRAFASCPQTELDRHVAAVHGKPVIVLCNSAVSVRELRAGGIPAALNAARLEYIAQPCGTERLGNAVKSSLEASSAQPAPPVTETKQVTPGAESPGTRMRTPDQSHKLSFKLPVRPNGDVNFTENSNAAQSPPLRSPRTPKATTPKSTVGEDYLSARSRSTGDRPSSPAVVDPVLPKKPVVRKAVQPPVPPSGLSLLLVDDNQINLQLLVNYAKKQGHSRSIATDGQKAVDAYKAACLGSGSADTENNSLPDLTEFPRSVDHSTPLDKPQVILMDINMPVLNGFEATKQIRKFEQKHGLSPAYIIALTGLGSAGAQQEAFSSGVDLFLTKPVRLKELTKVLGELKSAMEEEKTGGQEAEVDVMDNGI